MANRNELAAYTSSLVDMSQHADLQERLRLYQVFSKLYEHHRALLDEILELESSTGSSLASVTLPYVQGFAAQQGSYLVTNLMGGKTQAITQPQQIWVIGRDSKQSLISVRDIRLSRHHAAIQYVANQGFYLIDLGSRNQSMINGEPVRQALLKDGDQIRLGSVAFTFFLCESMRSLRSLPPEILAKLQTAQSVGFEDAGQLPEFFSANLLEEDNLPTLEL
ncbi:MAG: FHA domain-containing protein [Pegethrix bostrychoides GSE-TBD4-15B]|jgi:pSer/pThr/pTyr-binding forkhead associated (FHA) protein|uniref:FHA domain-containing protein n=1 Tax=Pegethrix bostrychoides GSE-TBD4-15B TaxID=2839662 RepID=A0A951U8L5_9CYAN|nr:FHA domain-containing protein [Pegethrix bostrychoides GSE-TBD4-15B]